MAGTVMLITKPWLGHVGATDRQFGEEMLEKFLHVLEGSERKPDAICFYTEGVALVCEGSPVLMSLRFLVGMGVRIAICQSCLNRYGLAEKVAVGDVGGMDTIVSLLTQAETVVSP